MWVCRRVARYLDNSYAGELITLTMGLSGIESLWILGSTYSLGGRASVLQIRWRTNELAKYLVTLLQTHIGQTSSYIKDSGHFISKISILKLNPGDRLISFDVASLFIKDTQTLIQQIFPEDIKALFQHCLTTSHFQWDNEFYEQTDGVAMGSPLR